MNYLKTAIYLFVTACFLSACNDDNVKPVIREFNNRTITSDTTFSPDNGALTINGTLSVSGARLTILPGTIIQLNQDANIVVTGPNSGLTAIGEVNNPIVFTSKLSDPKPGNWHYIQFREGAIDCILKYCKIEYGGGNPSWGMIDVQSDARLSIMNCDLSDSENYPVQIVRQNGFTEFSGNIISSSTGHAIKILGSHVHTIGMDNEFVVPTRNGILVTGAASNMITIEADVMWKAQNCAYIVEDPIRITKNSTLSIQAGSELRFLAGKYLEIGYLEPGRLIAIGSEDAGIVFTSASANPQKGDFGGIRFSQFALEGSIMDHCVISWGGPSPSFRGNINIEPSGTGNPEIRNSLISHSKEYGIYLKRVSGNYGDPFLLNNTFEDNDANDIGEQ